MKSILSSISSVLVAVAASLLCQPFMALTGMLGVSAASLIWLSNIKNHLITFSLIAMKHRQISLFCCY